MDAGWTAERIGDQRSKTILITGANTGVGFETARILAQHGAAVILACRNVDKATTAANRIRERATHASLRTVHLDLASLASVRAAAAEVRSATEGLNALICNAGVGWPPHALTEDGFERTFATNHLGHFALTGLLLDRLLGVPSSRVVVITSPAHRQGAIDFDDLHSDRGYDPRRAYAQSKLANLLFVHELNARLGKAGSTTISVAAHPGMARSEFNRHLPLPFRGRHYGIMWPLSHSPDRGALSILRAALDPMLHGGEYIAPGGRMEFRGTPESRRPSDASFDLETQRRLWQVSEALTGVRYEIEGALARSAGPNKSLRDGLSAAG
jgi:NAD(P)-dependent dehydrogenase (short-subunit alcohol dehydrogenase family)